MCGGTATTSLLTTTAKGLSPRVRGNPGNTDQIPPSKRSIPACAGEPWLPHVINAAHRVYPRVCGGTVRDVLRYGVDLGLSPRVRGNRDILWQVGNHWRSIPACAGEPL